MAKRRDLELEILDYDTSSAGVMSDAQLERARREPAPVTEVTVMSSSLAQRGAWTPGKSALERLPAMPRTHQEDGDDAAFNVATGAALANGAGGQFEHTSASDKARADVLRFYMFAAAFALIAAGAGIGLFTDAVEIGLLLACLGTMCAIAVVWLHVQSLAHSSGGVARLKVRTMRQIHQDRLASRERMATQMSGAWLRMVEGQLEHERQMELMRVRNGRK